MRTIRLWPRGLVGRVTLVLLAAVLLELIGSTVFYEQAETYSAEDLRLAHAGEQLATNMRLLAATPPEQRARVAAMLSTSDLRLSWSGGQSAGPALPSTDPLYRSLADQLRAYGQAGLRLDAPRHAGDVAGSLRFADGSALYFTAPAMLVRHAVTRGLLSAAILAGCVLLTAIMLVRTLSSPLRALSGVADAIGRGPPIAITEDGPREVRHLARAMNAMQERINRLIADRTEALAAVSHDLRTPLARLRLRAGFVDERELQAAIEADVDDMEAMVGSVLSYLAGEDDPEPQRPVDLAALLTTLIDEASDAGRDARYVGPDHALAMVRPLAMKRVFANLVLNAIEHAGNVVVTVGCEPSCVRIRVEDDGPGIPGPELARVLTPFHRVEGSRSRATGGLGLGLAIVQRGVTRDGGTMALSNRPEGGLRVEISLNSFQDAAKLNDRS